MGKNLCVHISPNLIHVSGVIKVLRVVIKIYIIVVNKTRNVKTTAYIFYSVDAWNTILFKTRKSWWKTNGNVYIPCFAFLDNSFNAIKFGLNWLFVFFNMMELWNLGWFVHWLETVFLISSVVQ